MFDKLLETLAKLGILTRTETPDVLPDPLSKEITVIYPNSAFKGDLRTSGDVVVYGSIEGAIDAQGSVYLHAGSTASRVRVNCKYLQIKGHVAGIQARTDKFVFDGAEGSIMPVDDFQCCITYGQMSLRATDNFDTQLKRKLASNV